MLEKQFCVLEKFLNVFCLKRNEPFIYNCNLKQFTMHYLLGFIINSFFSLLFYVCGDNSQKTFFKHAGILKLY